MHLISCGKTTTLQWLQSELAQEKDIIISHSLAVDKDRVSLGTLMTALFYDLTTEKDLKLPKEPEQRERRLLGLIQKCRKPVMWVEKCLVCGSECSCLQVATAIARW